MHNFFGASRFLNWTKGSEVNDQSPKNSSKKSHRNTLKKKKRQVPFIVKYFLLKQLFVICSSLIRVQ